MAVPSTYNIAVVSNGSVWSPTIRHTNTVPSDGTTVAILPVGNNNAGSKALTNADLRIALIVAVMSVLNHVSDNS